MSLRFVAATAAVSAVVLATAPLGTRAATELDYEFFKAKVQPIFLMKRPGHAPCVVCHAGANNQLKLQNLDPGATSWTEDETRQNFDTVSKIVNAVDDPLTSKLLIHPLAPEAGGDAFHSGGRQFANKNDPLWKTLVAFSKGAKLEPAKEKGGKKK